MFFNLIQRATIRTNKRSEIVGIDSLLQYDYMGSSEFECGYQNKSLKALFPVVNKLCCYQTKVRRMNGQFLFIVCTPEQLKEVEEFVYNEVYGIPARIKERTWMQDSMTTKDQNVWWDIENHWFAVWDAKNAGNITLAIEISKNNMGH